MKFLAPCLLFALLAACGADDRFLIAPATDVREARVRVATIEVREVSLPAYAAASEIVVEQPSGALQTVKNAMWADDSVRGVTGTLARSLDLSSTASVAAEPWPLAEPAQARVEVRVDRMVARNDGRFELSGQFAIAAPEGAVSERVERFEILTPLVDLTPPSIAVATGAAVDALAQKIIARLRR